MKILIAVFLISSSAFANNLFNLSYTTSAVLFNYTPPENYDKYFRSGDALGYHRYEISYQHCSKFCFSYGVGNANENFTVAKYAETSPLYVTYKLDTNYTYGTFTVAVDNNPNAAAAFVFANLGTESSSIEKYSGMPNGSTSNTYIRTEIGVTVRYYFLKLPAINIERIYLEGGASFYSKSMSDINFDNQNLGKVNRGNILLNVGAGVSF